MNLLKKNLALLLAVALCLSLAACGGDNDAVVGDDWRVTGVVCASGTITRDDGNVDVLVMVGDNGASFFWDDPDHTLFDSVNFPFTIPNARECFNEISFADLTANGESDVEISFTTDSGITYLTWLWDPEGYYVFRGDLSTYSIDGADLSEYTGLWQWEGESLWLCIYDDETWAMFDDQENMVQAGSLWMRETGIVLYFYDTGDVVPLDLTVSGDLVNIENDLMFVPAGGIQSDDGFQDDSFQDDAGIDPSEYIGLWEYVDEDVWILIYEDETWECLDAEGYAFQSGTLSVDSTGITFYSDDIDETLRFDRTVSGDLIESENGGMLVPADSIPFGDSGDISAYAGCWEYPDGTVLEIDNDSWYLYEADEYLMIAWGMVEFDGDAAYLMYSDGSSGGGAVYFDEDGDLIDSSGDVLTYLGLSIDG